MNVDPTTIDLRGYQRLHALEEKLAGSAAAVAVSVAAATGILVTLFGFLVLNRYVALADWEAQTVGTWLFLGGLLFTAAAAGLGHAYRNRLLARMGCPRCGQALVLHAADLGESEQGRFGEKSVWRAGRRYSPPFIGEHDHRCWIRVMKEVWVCDRCRTYVDSSTPHERTCTPEELDQLQDAQ